MPVVLPECEYCRGVPHDETAEWYADDERCTGLEADHTCIERRRWTSYHPPMHINNVGEYAPAGYRLVRSDMAGGGVKHVFATASGVELECLVPGPSTAESERATLEAFRAKHTVVTPKRSR